MKLIDLEAIPDDSWNLPELGKYCRNLLTRSAADAWRIGRAIAIARKQQERGDYETWLTTIRLSKTTAWRYQEIASKYGIHELIGRGISEVMIEMGLKSSPPIEKLASAACCFGGGGGLSDSQPEPEDQGEAEEQPPHAEEPKDGRYPWEAKPKWNTAHTVEAVRTAAEMLGQYEGPTTPAFSAALEELETALERFTVKP
jgi:hypothetical protein